MARHYTNIIEDILQAFSDIASVLPRVDRLKTTFRNDADLNQALGLIYSDIVEFFQRSYKFFRCKAWHFWFTFNWGLFERRFRSILQRLSSHCDLLDREAASIHFSEMKRFRDKRQLEEEAFERHRESQMAESVFRLLSAVEDDQEEYLHRISDDRQPQTCNWVLEDPVTRSWIEDEDGDPVLWMTGIPGSGKSFLCSLIIQNLQTRQDTTSLYYFCGNKSSTKDSSAMVLRTLAIQLLRQNPGMVPLVHQASFQHMSSCSFPALKKILGQILPNAKYTRIIIDGIDENEFDIQQELLKILLDIQKRADHNCKLLVSSREEPQIQRNLLPKIHLKLGERTSKGLCLYIKTKAKEIREHFSEMDPKIVDPVEENLHNKAKGMFLWVRLVTSMLIQQTSQAELESAIDQLPEGLDEAYGQIISRIGSLSSISRNRAFKILYWVCAAYRPVKINEVADGIVLCPGQTVLSKKTRSSNLDRDIVQLCAPLLETSSTGVLDLVHFSAREYLVDKQSGPFIDVTQAHLSIALSCIVNLTSSLDLVPRFRARMTETNIETRVSQGSYGLQSYGHEYWAEHTVAYLARIEDLNPKGSTLISTLMDFAPICKHQREGHMPNASTGNTAIALDHLRQIPALFNLVSGWLLFKSKLCEEISKLDTLEAQQEWKLHNDETHLSLMDSRLCIITERLLMMQPSNLPSHIDSGDYQIFMSRSNFPCRFLSCSHCYNSMQDRDLHEASHVLSFPCLQCDFAERGFRSRKDLDKHTRKYHMSLDDFEIPPNLLTAGIHSRDGDLTSGSFHGRSQRSTCWSEQGRQVLQRGFQKVFETVESEVELTSDNSKQTDIVDQTLLVSIDTKIGQDADRASLSTILGTIHDKIEYQQYETLAELKHDVSTLLSAPEMHLSSLAQGKIGSFCEQEIKKATVEFPTFASFGESVIGSGRIMDSSRVHEIDFDQSQEIVAPLSEHAESTALFSSPSWTRNTPYWSKTEEMEFPILLQRCGRDFVRIADHLKTKTVHEVGRYFLDLVESGREDLLDMAESAEVRLQQESAVAGPMTDVLDTEPENSGADHDKKRPPQLAQPLETLNLYQSHLQDLSTISSAHRFEHTTGAVHSSIGNSEIPTTPKTNKRKPRQKVLCPHCTRYKDGLYDEYAMNKHVDRFHKITRKVWICKDISIDKKFFGRCQPCMDSKRYSSWSNAGKHLRQAHFSTETSSETLRRWMQETEEPNPKYQPPDSEILPISRRPTKRQKTEATAIFLPPVLTEANGSKILPSMLSRPEHENGTRRITVPNSSPASNSDEDERSPSPTLSNHASSMKDVYLADVSLVNVLPTFPNHSTLLNNNGLPHRANRTLIKPDQVSRLPHLDSFRKRACQDQVEALYQRLDEEPVDSARYKEELENLTSLSRTLMSNLRDWRQHSTLAPKLPFFV